MSNIQKQHKISPAIAWLMIQKFIIFYCPLDGEHTTECALTSLAVDEPLEYARLYLDGNLQMWVDTEDSLELY